MKRLSTTKAELKKGIAYKQKGYSDKHQKDIENWKRNLNTNSTFKEILNHERAILWLTLT